MHAEEIREFALQKNNVAEGFPFGPDNLVLKVNNKMFLLISLDEVPLKFNAKCDPDKAIELREAFPESIFPGYHMNKKHWNTIIAQDLKEQLLKELIDDSYDLVSKKKK